MRQFSLPVILVHGIHSRGSWYKEVERVLGPHFRCIKFHYWEYLIFGVVQVVLGSTWRMALICGGGALVGIWIREIDWAYVSVILLTVAVLSSGARVAVRRRLKRMYDDAVRQRHVPHLVAHSYGTWLSGSLLSKYPDVRFDRVIMVGSVLRRDFWQRFLSRRSRDVASIRNELGALDIVVRLAGWTHWIGSGLGDSGVVGFEGSTAHSVASPLADCDVCLMVGQTRAVHNVPLGDFGHVDHFLGGGHARTLWLPFLWGIPPGEYREFVDICLRARRLEVGKAWGELADTEEEFRSRTWTFALVQRAKAPFATYVRHALKALAKYKGWTPGDAALETASSLAVRLVWCAVHMACQESEGGGDDWSALSLHPRTAVGRAVDAVVEMRQ